MEQSPAGKSRLSSKERKAIAIAAVTAAPGFVALLTVILGSVLAWIYGHSARGPTIQQLTQWLAGVWFGAILLGVVTIPLSVVLAIVTTFLSLVKRAKILIWTTAVGGALAWFIADRVVFAHRG